MLVNFHENYIVAPDYQPDKIALEPKPMIRIPLFCLMLCACASLVQAQDRKEELHSTREEIKPFRKWEVAYDFKLGEEIVLTVESTNGRKINRIVVREPSSTMNNTARRTRFVDKRRIFVYKDGSYVFQFRNRSIFRNSFTVKIERMRRMIDQDTLVLDDLIFSTRVDSLTEPFIDTIPIPDVSFHEIFLTPSLDIDKRNDTCFVEALLDGEYQYAAYWMGIGKEANDAYEKLKSDPPPAWSLYQINEPIVAYGLGLTEKLPMARNALAKDVLFRVQPPRDSLERRNREYNISDKRSGNFGIITMDKAAKYKQAEICIKNFNTTTGVPIYIRVAKFKIDKGVRPKIIIRERTQEIYIKSTYEVIDPSE